MNKITKQDLVKKIKELQSFGEVARHFGVDRKIIYKKRKEYNIFELVCGEQFQLTYEQVDSINEAAPKDMQIISSLDDIKKEVNHFIISDMQISQGVDLKHLTAIAKEVIDRKPDVLIFLGDFWDMKSLYNITKDQFDGKKYKSDVRVGIEAMRILMELIIAEEKKTGWKLRKVFCLGNHEHRINKIANSYKALNGLVSIDDLELSQFNFEVVEFLKPIIIDDIAYCHYFTNGLMNTPIQSTRLLVQRKLMNCVMGHKQAFSIHREVKASGEPVYAIFAGSSYLHDEEYLTEQGNHYSRQVWALNNVGEKTFEPEILFLNRLMKKWGC
ncbi:MAG: Metallophos protein [Campylobacterota bacterium]|nr:Metallophos protein [Campylobacterota bacterium]